MYWLALLQLALSALAFPQTGQSNEAACDALASTDFSSSNTTILSTTYITEPTTFNTSDLCYPTANASVELCRVHFVVNTSSISAVTAEAWLPASWNERFLVFGNGGLNGCQFTQHFTSKKSKI